MRPPPPAVKRQRYRHRFVERYRGTLEMQLFTAYDAISHLDSGLVRGDEKRQLQEKLLCRFCRVSPRFSHPKMMLPTVFSKEEGLLQFLMCTPETVYYMSVRKGDDLLTELKAVDLSLSGGAKRRTVVAMTA
tara:strand:- start:3827 stop:4222 length:396 start_codon:yes stop_codon:yes gene_type:complete